MLVIVGGGFAGLEAAIQLRTLRPNCEVTVISPGPSLIHKPWLIYVPAGRRRFAEPCIPLAPLAAHYGFHLIEDRVDRVDLDTKQVRLLGGRAADYSELLLAAGPKPIGVEYRVRKSMPCSPAIRRMPRNWRALFNCESCEPYVSLPDGIDADLDWNSQVGSPLGEDAWACGI